MARSRVRALRVAGLRIAVEVPGDLAWDWSADPRAAFASRPARADVRIGVRVAELPVPSGLRGGEGCEIAFGARGALLGEWCEGRLERVLHMDPGLETGELLVSPSARCVRTGAPPLGGLDEILFRHRVAREGRVALDLCAVGPRERALAFCGSDRAILRGCREALDAAGEHALEGLWVLGPGPEGPVLHPTPWMRGPAPGPSPVLRLAVLHVVRRAPAVLAEPLPARAAAAAVAACSPALAGDAVGEAVRRAALGLLLSGVRVVRLGAPRDVRFARYALGPQAGRGRPGNGLGAPLGARGAAGTAA